MRSILGPRRVVTTPAVVHSSEYNDENPEEIQLVNFRDSESALSGNTVHEVVDDYYTSDPAGNGALVASGINAQHHSSMAWSENGMPYLDSTNKHESQLSALPAPSDENAALEDLSFSTGDDPVPAPQPAEQSTVGAALLGMLSSYLTPAPRTPDLEAASRFPSAPSTSRLHTGPVPRRQPRRYRTIKRVPLYDGHLVLDCPVPSHLLQRLPIREGREFNFMRYTAVTCDPDEFVKDRYTLRQQLYQPPRATELCIILTMYNEDEKLFTRTLHGVMRNISYLCSLKKHPTWGPDSWKKVVVVVIADGRLKVNSRTLNALAAMGVYQEGVGKNTVRGNAVEAHMYEYTTQMSLNPSMKFVSTERGIVPTQMLLCIKEHNRKKINSHRWAFNAFSALLRPNVCLLLDVGTMPQPRSIYRLWNEFDRDPSVGGACGEIVASKGKLWRELLNPLVAAQNFEYKLSNVLDKPMESAFGYISVLPGAFSAYRYEALQNDFMGHGPLDTYFKGEKLHGGDADADIFTSNMYLAEDRILAWELVTKRENAWLLRYTKWAQAETDVPETLSELISQRRRWLNGSFFTSIHAIMKFGYIYRSKHSIGRKILLHVEMLYQLAQLVFSWFSLANYFITFFVLAELVSNSVHWVHIPAIICEYIYLALLIYCFLLSMGNRPQGNKFGYALSMVIFSVLMLFMMAVIVYLAYKSIQQESSLHHGPALASDGVFVRVVVSLVCTLGFWMLASLMMLFSISALFAQVRTPSHAVSSTSSMFVRFPLPTHPDAFCNTHDVSWGTKGSLTLHQDLGPAAGSTEGAVDVMMPVESQDINDVYDEACQDLKRKAPKEEKPRDSDMEQKDYYATVRTNVVLAWTLTNAALAVTILNLPKSAHSIYLAILFYAIAALSCLRFLGALCYMYVGIAHSRLGLIFRRRSTA